MGRQYIVTKLKCRNPSFRLMTKARACKIARQKGSQGVKESVRERTFTLSKELPFWELEFRWTLKCSKSDVKVKTQWLDTSRN
jgi:hypothetical protein